MDSGFVNELVGFADYDLLTEMKGRQRRLVRDVDERRKPVTGTNDPANQDPDYDLADEDDGQCGRAGETTVQLWGEKAHLTVNRAHNDCKAWDLFIEFPPLKPRDGGETLDLRPPELSCKVQVKTVKANKRR